METRGLDAKPDASLAKGAARLHTGGSAGGVAVVGAVVHFVSKHFGGHFGDLARGADVPGTRESDGGGGGRNGGGGQPGKCGGAGVLGVGIGPGDAQGDMFGDVPAAGAAVLDLAGPAYRGRAGVCVVRDFALLWRWIWD